MSVSNMDSAQETVYRSVDESHVVMSDKVQSLAGSVYQEFEKMIGKYDHDVVKDLMPLVVNVLECLDTAYTDNQEHEVELELVREDNEQLVTQYEREKQLKKNSEQKLLEVEDCIEEERKELITKIESLESLVRMLELKAKNSSDHVFRLEEKENDMKKEFGKLHERYTDLLKTHMDCVERTKMLMSTNEPVINQTNNSSRLSRLPSSLAVSHMNRSSGPVSFGFQSLEEPPDEPSLLSDEMHGSSHDSTASNTSLKQEINDEISAEQEVKPKSDGITSPDEDTPNVMGKSMTNKEQRCGNTLYQELSFQETLDVDDFADVTGSWVHPGEYASAANDNFFGMGKEVENLILENNELLATKNALNIVKDDLILKVDELTSEQEVLRDELHQLRSVKDKLKSRVLQLEEELKNLKDQPKTQAKSDDEDEDVPMAQRKRFTRVEMARVLMERNQYKERLLELQEAVRWKEAIRAQRIDVAIDSSKTRGVWGMFSGLFRSKPELVGGPRKIGASAGAGASGAPGTLHYSYPNHVTPLPSSSQDRKRGVDYLDRGSVFSEKKNLRRALERREQYRQVRAHVRKEDGRLHAYGWSLPVPVAPTLSVQVTGTRVPVPVPVYCQPLTSAQHYTKVWCAAAVDLTGGQTRDGVFYNHEYSLGTPETVAETSAATTNVEPHIAHIQKELKGDEKVEKTSSLVWICSSQHSESIVAVMDAADPNTTLHSFTVCASHVLCISSVPGALPHHYDAQDPEPNVTELIEEENATSPIGVIIRVTNTSESEQDPVSEEFVMPTMWLGAQNGYLYIHSAVKNQTQPLETIKMADSVLSITHCCGRVLVALANGTVAVFRRRPTDARWNMNDYYVVRLGDSHASVRCMALVHDTVWCGYKNNIHVLDPISLSLKVSVEAHPRKESQVRQLAWLADGVWVSIRLDSTLRLYHAHTYQHLQDVDIEPYVSKMLGTGKLGFSFVRITALLVSTGRLWIGTGEGVVISVPLSPEAGVSVTTRTDKDEERESAEGKGSESLIPYCSMSEAQLSFHGHRDVVKFFIAVHGGNSNNGVSNMLVMSGGEGYVDFRNGDGMDCGSGTIPEEPENMATTDSGDYDVPKHRAVDMSHLIIWQVSSSS